jgi:cytochrome d ubiquinol oxidase subunit II
MLNAIGPVWDGNEVWLVTGGGALFAAFPDVYATLASGFYLAVFLLLFCLIFRAVSIEFRSKQSSALWRQTWDVIFSVSSILAAFLFGVVIGNLVWGIPLGADKEFQGSFFGLLGPYALLTGLTVVAVCMMHGSIYLTLKTQGEFHHTVRGWVNNTIVFFVIMYSLLTVLTLWWVPHMIEKFSTFPALFLVPVVNVLAIANVPRAMSKRKDFLAFLSSCAAIILLMFLFGLGIFPNLVLSNPNPQFSLTIYNASSSIKTLQTMLMIALIGMPLVLAYTVCIYRIFRGKVKLDQHSY